jgi:hypothetical protein
LEDELHCDDEIMLAYPSKSYVSSRGTGRNDMGRVERVDSTATTSTIESPFGSQLTTPVEEVTGMDFDLGLDDTYNDDDKDSIPASETVTKGLWLMADKTKEVEEMTTPRFPDTVVEHRLQDQGTPLIKASL